MSAGDLAGYAQVVVAAHRHLFEAIAILAQAAEDLPACAVRAKARDFLAKAQGLYVFLPREVRSELPEFLSGAVARPGRYQAKMNQFGAVSIRLADGSWLGVRPSEFEWCVLGPGDTIPPEAP